MVILSNNFSVGVSKIEAPLVHKVCEFYKSIYALSQKIPKKDRYGIYLKIENICLDTFYLTINASLETKDKKLPLVNEMRIKIEILKRFIRILKELNIIEDRVYLNLEICLQEISKMTNGWIKFLFNN